MLEDRFSQMGEKLEWLSFTSLLVKYAGLKTIETRHNGDMH